MENKFVDGLIIKRPHENAPEFVKAKISIKRENLIKWLEGQTDEWINLDMKESREGKYYAQVDDWKPRGANEYDQNQNQAQNPENEPKPTEMGQNYIPVENTPY